MVLFEMLVNSSRVRRVGPGSAGFSEVQRILRLPASGVIGPAACVAGSRRSMCLIGGEGLQGLFPIVGRSEVKHRIEVEMPAEQVVELPVGRLNFAAWVHVQQRACRNSAVGDAISPTGHAAAVRASEEAREKTRLVSHALVNLVKLGARFGTMAGCTGIERQRKADIVALAVGQYVVAQGQDPAQGGIDGC